MTTKYGFQGDITVYEGQSGKLLFQAPSLTGKWDYKIDYADNFDYENNQYYLRRYTTSHGGDYSLGDGDFLEYEFDTNDNTNKGETKVIQVRLNPSSSYVPPGSIKTARIIILDNDSSLTYDISTSSSSALEGARLISTVSTKGVQDGSILYWGLSGMGFSNADLSSGAAQGQGLVKNGMLVFSHTFAKDNLREGNEDLRISIFNSARKLVAESNVLVIDSSAGSLPDTEELGNNSDQIEFPKSPGVHTSIPDLKKSYTINESGSSYSWIAQLTTKPTDNVIVTYKSSDSTEGRFSNGQDSIALTFTPDNWNKGQKITIKGVDDEVNDGDIKFTVTCTAKSRLDTRYWGQNSKETLLLDPINFITKDDDKPDEVRGTDMNDSLQGGSGASDIYGLLGNDTIKGGKGNDRLYGGYGDDIIYGQEGNDEIEGEQGNDHIQGDAGNDSILGGSGSDEIYGGSGDDSINGETGADVMDGGEGSDTYYVDNKYDNVLDSGKTGKDMVYMMSYFDGNYPLGDGLDDLVVDSKAGKANVLGNASDNDITGNDSVNALNGGNGNDELFGGGGADTLFGGTGSDVLIGGLGNDKLDGGAGGDTVDYSDASTGSVNVDLAKGFATGDGNDTLTSIENLIASEGDDTITGSNADNVLTGGDGIDQITGGSGKDVFHYSSLVDSDLAFCDWIKDLVIGTDSIDSLYAVSKGSIAGTKSGSSLKVASLTETSIRQTLTASVFSAKGAAVLTYTSSSKVTQTFLALNDTRAGFQSTSDALINITGFSGSLANLAII